MSQEGHDVRFITVGPVLKTPLEVRSTPLPTGLWSAARSALRFFGAVRAFRPDLLHLHYAGGRLGTLAHLSGVHPLIATVIGGDVLAEQHEGGLRPAERRATEVILRDADLILAKSDVLKERVNEFGSYSGKTEVVRWGVDTRVFCRDEAGRARLRARFGVPSSARLILSPRALRPLYNIDLIVRAFARLTANDPNVFLALTEAGPFPGYQDDLRRQISSLGLTDRVAFWGVFDRQELPSLYSAADLVVSVPRSDGLPQSLFEAMACETPTVLGDLSAYHELAKQGEGVLFSELETEALATVISGQTSERLQEIGRAGRIRILKVADIGTEARRVSGLYDRVMSAPRRRRLPDPREAFSLLYRS